MNKKLTMIFLFGMMFFGFSFVSADPTDTLNVTVNVLETEIGITVPESVTFQDIVGGYMSERQDLDILNTGTADVSITPSLIEGYSGIFDFLTFKELVGDDESTNIRYFDFGIEKPSIVGGTREKTIYMYLDLTDYEETTEDKDHITQVIFTAVPA